MSTKFHKGRGAISNTDGRYEAYSHAAIDDGWGILDEQPPALKTIVTDEAARTIISRNDSPDVPFDRSINPYRGCEHGCVYCFARPTHAYHGLSPGLDFESRLFAKPDAARLLAEELRKSKYECEVIALGANTDCYQPIERARRITRGVLEVLAEHHHPVVIVTKSALIERDIDILAAMAGKNLAMVYISITTFDRSLARRLEPRAAAPARRIEVIRALSNAGIPTGVLTAPVIPALNDSEMEAILETAAEAGARWAGYVLLRLPLEIKDLFKEWLAEHAPLKAEHVMSLIRQSREGKENDAHFGSRMRGAGLYAQMIEQRFRLACKRQGLNRERLRLDTGQFRVPARAGDQLVLF
ncbi:MAG: PA0069 family radical SAM protein [Pseudomonadota bacterium]